MFKIGDIAKAASEKDEEYFISQLPGYKKGSTLVVLRITEQYVYVKVPSGGSFTSSFPRRLKHAYNTIPEDGEWE